MLRTSPWLSTEAFSGCFVTLDFSWKNPRLTIIHCKETNTLGCRILKYYASVMTNPATKLSYSGSVQYRNIFNIVRFTLSICRVNNLHTHDSVKPYVRSKGRKFEKARGRRRSNGFKVNFLPYPRLFPTP